jgi:hypothetical protein
MKRNVFSYKGIESRGCFCTSLHHESDPDVGLVSPAPRTLSASLPLYNSITYCMQNPRWRSALCCCVWGPLLHASNWPPVSWVHFMADRVPSTWKLHIYVCPYSSLQTHVQSVPRDADSVCPRETAAITWAGLRTKCRFGVIVVIKINTTEWPVLSEIKRLHYENHYSAEGRLMTRMQQSSVQWEHYQMLRTDEHSFDT